MQAQEKRPKLLLHFGTHKTGTSSFQRFLFKNKDQLRRQGLYYPPTPKPMGKPRQAHHQVAGIAMEGRNDRPRLRALRKYFEAVHTEANPGEVILMSSEQFWRGLAQDKSFPDNWTARAGFLKRLHQLTAQFDVEIHVFFRRQDDLLWSLYRGRCLRSGKSAVPLGTRWTRYLPQYAELDQQQKRAGAQVVADPGFPPFGITLAYFRNLDLCSQIFGRDRIHAHLYASQQRGLTGLQGMFAQLGCPPIDLSDMDYQTQHAYPKVACLADFFRLLVRPGDSKEQIVKLRDHLLHTMADPAYAAKISTFFSEERHPFPDLLGAANDENERLAAAYFPDVSGPLFGAPVSDHLPVLEPQDLEAAYAEATALRQHGMSE